MILELKHKKFKGPFQVKDIVLKIFHIGRNMPIPRAFELYYFRVLYFGPNMIFIPPPSENDNFPPLVTHHFLTPIVAFLL
jgi:hypothetical protein